MCIAKKVVFLLDDNEVNLATGKKILSEKHTAVTFSSDTMLFKALEKRIPDLILLDIEMPEISGYEVIERITSNELYRHIPVIFLTANNKEDAELKGLSMGAVDFIAKPFSPLLLLKRIEVHLLLHEQKNILAQQKNELLKYSSGLEKMVAEKTKEITALKNAILEVMSELAEHRDGFTGGHITRTPRYIEIFFNAINKFGAYKKEMSSLDEKLAVLSSQLHDIGKISIKDSILLKPDKLTHDEFEEMKLHVELGEKIISRIKERTDNHEFFEYARTFVKYHHEKWDGSGYPQGIKGEDIPLLGRIMAIADVYDALVSERPYKKALSHETAVAILKDAKGTHFDPMLIDLFAEIHREFEKISARASAH
ncbi:MAG: response regulator [Defluviitaleaceae bacterium]|nr:response regulator [Defluviitaleaceae bacterium]